MSDGTFPYTFPFFFYDTPQKKVRAFVGIKPQNPTVSDPIIIATSWFPTGSSTYTVGISSSSLYFKIDGELKATIPLDETLFGNIKFGEGNYHSYDKMLFQLIDTSYQDWGDTSNFSYISGALNSYSIKDLSRGLMISTDSGNTWTEVSGQKLDIMLGWNYDYIRGEYKDEESIEKYGLHLYRHSENLITKKKDAETLARRYVETYKDGVKTGAITIKGRTGISIKEKFRLKIPRLGINEVIHIASYKQIFNKNGFFTQINYGSEPYDIAVKIARLEKRVFS